MKSIVGITIIIVMLFMFNSSMGPDVVALAVVTLCLWHGIWRLIDHFEITLNIVDRPLISAVITIGAGTAIAVGMNKFRVDHSINYLEQRF